MNPNFFRFFGAILIGVFVAGYVEAWADDVEEGRAAISAGQYEKARRLLLPKAKQGNSVAQNSLGALYLNGWSVSRDYGEALQWFRKAAAQEDPRAQFNLGRMYEEGQGVARNYAEAEKWYRKSADQGYPPGQSLLAAMYARGYGVRQDYAEAMKWYRKAADQGDAVAQSRIGYMFVEGQGVPTNYQEAEKWFRMSASQGHPLGYYWLGRLYFEGWGLQRNYKEAVKWSQVAADQETPEAQYILGYIYANGGNGIEKDNVMAIMWLRRAAMYGDAEAHKLLKQRFDIEPEQGPSLVHPEQAIRAPSDSLAHSYLAVSFAAKILEPARLGRFGATLVTRLDGRADTITASNAVLYLAGYQDRLRVYGLAIARRGYEAISGTYRAVATSSCGHIQSMWASGIREGVLGNLNISQDGFKAQLVYQFQLEGKSHSVEIPSIVVESALAFQDPANSDFGFLGQIASGEITVRPDVDAILAAWPNWVKAPSRKDLSECVVTLSPIRR